VACKFYCRKLRLFFIECVQCLFGNKIGASTHVPCPVLALRLHALSWFSQDLSMLLVGWQEGHPACQNWVGRYWRGYLCGARCSWFAYGPADATATPSSSLIPVKSRMVCLSDVGLSRLSWKKRPLNRCGSSSWLPHEKDAGTHVLYHHKKSTECAVLIIVTLLVCLTSVVIAANTKHFAVECRWMCHI